MRVFLERVNSDYLFEVENKNGQKVLLDNSSKTSGKVEGVSPMELLLMGVAGCSAIDIICLLYTSPSPRDRQKSRMPSSA